MMYFMLQRTLFTHAVLSVSIILLLVQCKQGEPQEEATGVMQIEISNTSVDTINNFGLDLDLIPIDSNMRLVQGDVEIPFQFEDRNENGLPDKLFAPLQLNPGSRLQLNGIAGMRQRPTRHVQLFLQSADGTVLSSYDFASEADLRYDGLIFENEWIGYRANKEAPFAFDVIGKSLASLQLQNPETVLQGQKWGEDVLDEGNSLGIGSPAVYDLNSIVRFSTSDSREIKVLANGPLRSAAQIVIKGIPVRDEKIDIGIELEMQAGNQWLEVETSLLSPTDLTLQLAFGLPKHPDATDFTQGVEEGVHFAYTHGLQSADGDQLGMALLVPAQYELDHYREDPEDYFYLATPVDRKVRYRILAAWVKGRRTIFDEVQFLDFVRSQARIYARTPEMKVHWRQ